MNPTSDPSDLWYELASDGTTMLPGPEPGTAIRVVLESCPRGGSAHLDQMAHSPTLGWYRQRRFTVPRAMLGQMARLLRMGDCLLPETAPAEETSRGGERLGETILPFPTGHDGKPTSRARERSG